MTMFQRLALASTREAVTLQAHMATVNGTAVSPRILCNHVFLITSNMLKPYPTQDIILQGTARRSVDSVHVTTLPDSRHHSQLLVVLDTFQPTTGLEN